MADKQIQWEHWEEPENPLDKLNNNNKVADHWDDYDDEEGFGVGIHESLGMSRQQMFSVPIPTHYPTPIGMYSWSDPMQPSKMCDCWMMHANFNITEDVAKTVGAVPGVEIATVVTRYRMFIGVSPVFKFRDVRVAIETALCGFPADQEMHVAALKNELTESGNLWAIHIDANGIVDYIVGDPENRAEYDESLNHLRNKNGQLQTSEDPA